MRSSSLETEKVDLEVNADKGGVLASIKRREGEDVKIGELLGVVDEAAAASGNGAGKGAGNSAAGNLTAPLPKPQRRRHLRQPRPTRERRQRRSASRASTMWTSGQFKDQVRPDA